MQTLSRSCRVALPPRLLRLWLLPLLALLSASALLAQALPTATGPGSYVAVGGGGSIFQTDYGQRNIGGLTAYADINPTWRYGIEAEARFLRFRTSEQLTETNYLIGPRVALRFGPLRPYVKFLVGDGKVTLPFHYAQGSFLTYAPGGGVEYMLGDRLAVRVLDVEYQLWPAFPYGKLRPYGISAGISFRLNAVGRFPKGRSRAYARESITQ
jgi:hypothetical protein